MYINKYLCILLYIKINVFKCKSKLLYINAY